MVGLIRSASDGALTENYLRQSNVFGHAGDLQVVIRHTFVELELADVDASVDNLQDILAGRHALKSDSSDKETACFTESESSNICSSNSSNAASECLMVSSASHGSAMSEIRCLSLVDDSTSPVARAGAIDQAGTKADDVRESFTRTAMVLEPLPRDCTVELLSSFLNSQGLQGCYDFICVRAEGGAIVNMVSHAGALRAFQWLSGSTSLSIDSKLKVHWHNLQGFHALVEKFRALHASAPNDKKPRLFDRLGALVPFPKPTAHALRPQRHGGARDVVGPPGSW